VGRAARNELAAAAVAAARRGWAVFPCRRGDKRPAIARWPQLATANPAHIAAAWRDRFPYANVGVACGPSRLVVIDLDTTSHGAALPEPWASELGVRDGQDVLAVLAGRAGHAVPETYTVRTPSGGQHLYFAAPGDREIRNSASEVGPMIDVRGAGGYIVAVGSVVGGRRYELVHDAAPLPVLPAWLAALAAPARPGRPLPITPDGPVYGRLRGVVETVLASQPGQRNGLLHWAACRAGEMVAAGQVDRATAEALLVRAAVDAGLRGGESEARRTIASGFRSAGAP